MIRERPGEPNDHEFVISSNDSRKKTDIPKFRENYDKINWKDDKELDRK